MTKELARQVVLEACLDAMDYYKYINTFCKLNRERHIQDLKKALHTLYTEDEYKEQHNGY